MSSDDLHKMYSCVWHSLHKTNLKEYQNESFDFPLELDELDAREYFEQVDNYKAIDLTSVNCEDLQLIKQAGLSLDYINFNISQIVVNAAIEANNCLSSELPHQKKERRDLSRISAAIQFQLRIVSQKYISAVCPYSGNIINSNRSVVDSFGNIFYRFEVQNQKPFYLITGDFWYEKVALYLPYNEIIVNFLPYKSSTIEKKHISHFKSYIVANWSAIQLLFATDSNPQSVLIIKNNHFAHHVWNELSAIYRIYEHNLLGQVDKFLVVNEPLGSITSIFPEIEQSKIEYLDKDELLKEICNRKYFVLSLGHVFIKEDLIKRIHRTSLQKCSRQIANNIAVAKKKHFPLLWISIRLANRTWIYQERGIVNIIKCLANKYPDVGVVIDGFSLPQTKGEAIEPSYLKIIEEEKSIVNQIQHLVPERVTIYNNVGCNLYESIVWANAIDLYLAHQGSVQHKVGWFSNAPGIIHTNTEYLRMPFASRPGTWERENSTVPTYVSEEYITDVEKKVFIRGKWRRGSVKNYKCDWKGVFREVFKLSQKIQQERDNFSGLSVTDYQTSENSRKETMLSRRFERLNALSKINSASKYLEVGVCKGVTFNQVNVPFKVAVDPKFQFNSRDYADQNTIFHEVTSDQFFVRDASKYKTFDLIYLDGFHTFEQTFRDFCASLTYSHINTIWLIDDTHPISLFAADPDRARSRRLQKIVKDESRYWMGDLYKVVFAIHDFFPQFSYATFPGHGQTVIWAEPRQNFSPVWNSLQKISNFKYDDFLEHKSSLMNIKSSEEIIQKVKKAVANRHEVLATK